MASSLFAISKVGSSSLALRRLITKSLRKTDIHENNVASFKKDVTYLVNRYRLKEAKELFKNIGEDLDDFYRLSQAVKNGQLSERNSKRLEELLGKFHVIKAAMRIIENKRGDYHL